MNTSLINGHFIRAVMSMVLLSMTYYASTHGAPKDLVHSLTTWTGISIGWFFGALSLIRR